MNALSSYISGRTPGGAGRAGNNSQQSQQDSRNNRGGSSIPNGRMAMLVMKHLHNHLHGLVVFIIRVADHLEIEYDLTMIGK